MSRNATRKTENSSHPNFILLIHTLREKKKKRLKENAQGKKQAILRLYSQQLNRKTKTKMLTRFTT